MYRACVVALCLCCRVVARLVCCCGIDVVLLRSCRMVIALAVLCCLLDSVGRLSLPLWWGCVVVVSSCCHSLGVVRCRVAILCVL